MPRPTTSRLSIALLVTIILAFLNAQSRLQATTVMPMDLAELTDQAELVFTGEAIQKQVLFSKDRTFLYSYVTFTVDDVLKGRTRGLQIALRFAGGEADGRTLQIDGMPQFQEGERYLLFVRGNGTLACPVLGWWQGQFRYEYEAGSARPTLVDVSGARLRGIHQGRFERAMPEAAARASAQSAGGVTVLSEEGVHVVLDGANLQRSAAAAQGASPEAVDADALVRQLRSFIAGRRAQSSFRRGQLVESARTEDVPEGGLWSAARPH